MDSLLTRVRPFFQLLLSLVFVTVAVNAALQGLSAASLLTWPPRVMGGNGFIEDNRRRVAGAVEEYAAGRVGTGEHLGAFVGISNLREDVDLKAVSAGLGPNWRLLGLGGAGFGVSGIAPHAEALLASDLRPDLVVVGIGLHQVIDTRPKPGAFRAGFLEYVRRGDWRNTAVGIRNWLWFYARRQDVSTATESAVLDARDSLFHRWKVRLPEAETGRNSPWREMIKADWPAHFSSSTLREQEEFFAGLGVFDSSTYAHAPQATAALVDILSRFRGRGATVVLLVMPQHSRLTQRIPATAFDTLSGKLTQTFRDPPLAILDLRRAVADDGFVDLPHLNRDGSATFSRILAEQLRPYLPTTSALMSASRVQGVRRKPS